MLIGLAAKNAILIVEFAKMEFDKGKSAEEAALIAAKLRLRPILMTAFAFILGCVPLWTASGAGAISRRVLGTAVIGGMLAASVLAIFLIPVSFDVVERLGAPKEEASAASVHASHSAGGRGLAMFRLRWLTCNCVSGADGMHGRAQIQASASYSA